jgi:pimeloyl-ACP methyl ester carboxylesterase
MTKRTFVLVHGGAHRASCWNRLVPELEARGHRVATVDLPGHGRDPGTDPVPATLDDGIAATVAAIEAQDGPVVLVGHSLGGMSISGAAERAAERIARLVYLTALLPRDGESTGRYAALDGFNASVGSEFLDDGPRVGVKRHLARHLFYADCDDATAEAAIDALCATDLGYLTQPVALSEERFGRIPKTYIVCLQDHAIEPRAQRVMAANCPDIEVREFDSSHSGFLSKPAALADLLCGL